MCYRSTLKIFRLYPQCHHNISSTFQKQWGDGGQCWELAVVFTDLIPKFCSGKMKDLDFFRDGIFNVDL